MTEYLETLNFTEHKVGNYMNFGETELIKILRKSFEKIEIDRKNWKK